jgi:hypothetical protein
MSAARTNEPAVLPVVIILARPISAGRYKALVGDRVLVASTRQPLLDGARALLAEGADPDRPLVMRHAGSEVDALIATSIAAAKLTVQEGDRGGPYLRPWRPFVSLDVRPFVASGADPLVEEPGGAGTAPTSAPEGRP